MGLLTGRVIRRQPFPRLAQGAHPKPHLHQTEIPALVVNARNDPFVPAWSLPHQNNVGRHVTLWQPAHGGHVGFPQGRLPGHVRAMPDAVAGWLAAQAGLPFVPTPE